MRPLFLFVAFSCFLACSAPKNAAPAPGREHTGPRIHRIAFGSCGNQDRPMPILADAAAAKPDLFIWLGDNIYGDSEEPDTLRAKYRRLAAKPEYRRLEKTAPFIATWDDHDYGENDSGRHYPLKLVSKDIFLTHWKIPADDIRRTREGIYTSYFYGEPGKTVQVIVLDTRTFRDDLLLYDGRKMPEAFFYQPDYLPYETADSTLLGEQQWRWLETQLSLPADLRLIASSTQFGITFNGYEAWANFPHEQQRFVRLIRKTRANGVLFISGDVHYAEISKWTPDNCYPLYDATASGITSTWLFATSNRNRIEGPVMDNHFGLLDIDWSKRDPEIRMQIYDVRKALRVNRSIRLSELRL